MKERLKKIAGIAVIAAIAVIGMTLPPLPLSRESMQQVQRNMERDLDVLR